MAYTLTDFRNDLLILTAGGVLGRERLGRFYKHAARTGVNFLAPGFWPAPVAEAAGPGLARRVAGRLAVRSPYIAAGAALAEGVRRAPETIEDLWDSVESGAERMGVSSVGIKKQRTKYNRAVSAGMKALKASKFQGKPGTFSNSKKAFKEVNIIASKLNRGKKVRKTGTIGVLSKAMGKFFKGKK